MNRGLSWQMGTDRPDSEFPAKSAGNSCQACQSPVVFRPCQAAVHFRAMTDHERRTVCPTTPAKIVLGAELLKKLLLLVLLAGVAAVIVWGVLRKGDPPKVRFARVKRQTLVSTLPTNGKVEPSLWQAVRAETGGVVSRAPAEDGQTVAAGAVMAGITDPSLQADIDAAQAKLNEARANLASQEAGGRPAEFADIDNRLARAQFDLAQAQKVLASLQRLVAQHAATQQEADAAREKVQQSELEIAGLEKGKRSLVSPTEVAAARARSLDAET